MTIAVDFDGTIVKHKYPHIGTELPGATETLRKLLAQHHKLILWTVREGKPLQEAVAWCHERGVDFAAVNDNLPENQTKGKSGRPRKINADLIIDDSNLGGRLSWDTIYRIISEGKTIDSIMMEKIKNSRPKPKKSWWQELLGK